MGGGLRESLFEFDRDRPGYYGDFGGAFKPEILDTTLAELREVFYEAKRDPTFWQEFIDVMSTYSCRPTPVTQLERLSDQLGGARIYLKREDLNHTGAHKLNNVMGQGLLTKRMNNGKGKKRVIAETGAGQHGVATATMAARLGLECTVYMGEVDVDRQRPNVFWMQQLGAEVRPVADGTRTLKDAINEALRDWSESMLDTHYVMGTVCGPHPFPEMVAYFQSIIGDEARKQMLDVNGRLPARVYACVGGGSNALGIFLAFLDDDNVDLVGAEAGGKGLSTGKHAARLAPDADGRRHGSVGIAQGYKTYFLQDEDGQMMETHSVSAGLDYIGVSPIHARLHEIGRVRFESATDDEAKSAFKRMAESEGILPALESAHGVAVALRESKDLGPDEDVLINLSGRGDKDIFTIADAVDDAAWREFIVEKAVRYEKIDPGLRRLAEDRIEEPSVSQKASS